MNHRETLHLELPEEFSKHIVEDKPGKGYYVVRVKEEDLEKDIRVPAMNFGTDIKEEQRFIDDALSCGPLVVYRCGKQGMCRVQVNPLWFERNSLVIKQKFPIEIMENGVFRYTLEEQVYRGDGCSRAVFIDKGPKEALPIVDIEGVLANTDPNVPFSASVFFVPSQT